MKKQITFSVFLFTITTIFSFGQGVWIEENVNPDTGLKTGRIEVNGDIFEIKPNSNLSGANLSGANLSGANLSGANLSGADFFETDLTKSNLSGANLTGAKLTVTNLTEANISNADIKSAEINTIFQYKTNFSGVDLNTANWIGGFWIEENVDSDTGLRTGKIQIDENIYEIKPSADLSYINFKKTDLRFVNLAEADLYAADLSNTLLEGSNLAGAMLDYAKWESLEYGGISTGLSKSIYNDVNDLKPKVNSNKNEINALKEELQKVKAQLAELSNLNGIEELKEQVAELEKRPTIEQVRDARAGSVVLTVDPDGDNITLGFTIEQSDNLIEWTKLDGEIIRTIPIPENKKFYRFALDK